MNVIDRKFYEFVFLVKSFSEKELYYRIRRKFDELSFEVKKSCSDFFNQFGYWGVLDIPNDNYEEIELKAQVLSRHIDDFVFLYERLGDYRSRKSLYAILNNWYQYDFNTTLRSCEKFYDDYFDLDILECSKDEVIVDLGAYTGDTILSYFHNYGDDCYKKIYCYEVTPSTFESLKSNLAAYKNIDFRLKGVGEENRWMKLSSNSDSSANQLLLEDGEVEVVTLDSDILDKITLIKADIEGFEEKALKGAREHIYNDHPKLLISVYHHNDDLWKIPRMIYDIHPDYKFYLRFNSSPLYPTEITLIAV